MKIKCPHSLLPISRQTGVSLIELAISIAIIGILLALVIGGYSLMHSAQLRRTVVEITEKHHAIDEFEQEYHYLPGDLPESSNYWETYDAGPPITGAQNGNGNTFVDNNEDLYAWRHLALAGLLFGSYTGTVIDEDTRFGLDINAPASDIYVTALFRFYSVTDGVYDDRGHALQFGTLNEDGLPANGVITPKDAYSLDVKLDDGLANSGMFVSQNDTGTCVDESNQYQLDSTDKACNLIYWYKKF